MKIFKSVLIYAAGLAFWIMLWAVPSMLIGDPLILPKPTDVAVRAVQMAANGDFWLSVGASLLRVLAGVLIGAAAAVIFAVLASVSKIIRALLYPFNEVVKATPIVSFIFLAYIVFNKNIGLLPIFIVILIVFPVIYSAVLNELMNIDRELTEVAAVFGCSRFERLRYITIPTAINAFVTACTTAMGLGWKSGIAAEALAAAPALPGIGTELAEAKTYIETLDQFAWTLYVIVISIIIGALFSFAMRRLEKRIT